MNLQEMFEVATKELPSNRTKDIKTAVGTLARALGYETPRSCPIEAVSLPLVRIYHLVGDALAGKGPYTLRNTKNNLSILFRLAQARGIFSTTPEILKSRFESRDKPNRPGGDVSKTDGHKLPHRLWPQSLKDEFEKFSVWATSSLVEGRPAKWKKRPVTLKSYQGAIESFFGYLSRIRSIQKISFDQLFDFSSIHDYIHWSIDEKHRRPNAQARLFLIHLIAITNQYRPMPELRAQLRDLRRSIPRPNPVYDKADVWVPLAALDRVGQTLWPRKKPEDISQYLRWKGTNGTGTARNAGLSLMLRLWCRRPYRQRNMREMRLDENLYRNAEGKWIIRFAGEQLKVAQKSDRFNKFELPFPEDLVPQLEIYLSTWRPILVERSKGKFKHVFLNCRGTPYPAPEVMNNAVKNTVYRYTGKLWHPHMIRTTWATEYIRKTGDFYSAAVMLNDRLETVVKNYSHIMEHGIAEKTDRWIRQQFGTE